MDRTTIDDTILQVIKTSVTLAKAKHTEMVLEQRRPLVKSEAITRLMSQPDPQKDGKTYSATAADAIVMMDLGYAQHMRDQAEATAMTIEAMGQYEAAKFTARLAITGAELEGYDALRLTLDQAHTVVVR